MRRTLIRPAGVVALTALIAACTAGTPATTPGTLATGSVPPASVAAPASAAPATTTDFLADLDIGGRKMHILCVGPIDTGRPTVIFESGLGGDAGQWSDVLHELGGTTRACAYDRAGSGQSPAAAPGRTTEDQVADLRALLEAAAVPPPYVLVGFSVGGWNVLVHADAYPDDVAGAVLVEARPPAASQRWLAALPPASTTESEAIRLAREESTTLDTDPTRNPEGLLLGVSATQALETAGFGDKPLLVLAASEPVHISEGFEPAQGARMVAVWWELQDELASRSTKGRLVEVDDTQHEIVFQRPDAVADAIREVVGS
jgi:pimeloyl-ACP methyl ester carboxylesterase